MSGRASAARYARALLDVAIKESEPERIGQELDGFAALVAGNATLQGALTNPAIPVAAKRRVVQSLLEKATFAAPLGKILLMLAERDRLSLLPDMREIYRERLLEHLQVVQAEVTTATPLESADAARFEQRLASATGRKVIMTTRVDPSLIGGVVTRIGGTVYDGSLAAQLSKMRERLLHQG